MAAETATFEGRGRTSELLELGQAILQPIEGKVGIAIIVVFAAFAVLGSHLAPYGALVIGAGNPNDGPSAAHWLGTDDLGRDVLSRLIVGTSSVVVTPLIATLGAFVLGGLIGLLTGYLGGVFDQAVARTIDIGLSLPPLLVVLVVTAAFGTDAQVIVLAVALVYAPRVARVIRGATQGIATKEYVQAAQARGERSLPIVLREILPNIAPTVFVEFAVRLVYVILFITTLNFLGLGLHPPAPNWGLMVAESRAELTTNPVAALAPTVAIGALAIAIGLVADAVTQTFGIDRPDRLLR